MRISDRDRKYMWQMYEASEFRISVLKGIVQNPMQLTQSELDEHTELTKALVQKLLFINKRICNLAKESESEVEVNE